MRDVTPELNLSAAIVTYSEVFGFNMAFSIGLITLDPVKPNSFSPDHAKANGVDIMAALNN